MVERNNTFLLKQMQSNEEQPYPSRSSSYKLDAVVGMGTFGLVWKAKIIEGDHKGVSVAIKIIDLE